MPSQVQNPGLVLSVDSGVGGVDWTNPSNASTSNDSHAEVALNNGQHSDRLKAKTFGFTVPLTSTVTGIKVEVERKGDAAGVIQDNEVFIAAPLGGSTSDKATGAFWPASDAIATYGGEGDLWGVTGWTPAYVNDNDLFNVYVGCKNDSGVTHTGYVDHIRVTVYYDEGPGSGTFLLMGTGR